MRGLLFTLIGLLANAGIAFAQPIPVISGGPPIAAGSSVQVLTSTPSVLSNAGNRFFPVGYSTAGGAGADLPSLVAPVGGTLQNARARAVTTPSGAATWVVTLNKNGVATAITCTISVSVNPCVDSTHTVTLSPGDYVDWQSAPSGSPLASILSAVIDFVPTNANDTILPAYGAGFSTSVTQAQMPFSDFSVGTVANRESAIIPESGTLDKLFVVSNAPGAGTQYAYGVDLNGAAVGSPSSIIATIANTATTASDTTNSATVTALQNLELTATPTGTPSSATAGFGLRYVPATAKDFPFIGGLGAVSDSSSVTTFFSLTGQVSATEANVQSLVNNMTVTQMIVNIFAQSGAGTTKTFTLNKNGVATGLTCPISNTATTCTATGSVSVADGDLLDVADAPTTGAPASRAPTITLVAHR